VDRALLARNGDVLFVVDLTQIRTRHGPVVMASLRYVAISLHRSAASPPISPQPNDTSAAIPTKVLTSARVQDQLDQLIGGSTLPML
jgi:hypothetical protein